MSLYQDSKKSYYAILANKVKGGNQSFQVASRTGCRDSRGNGGKVARGFQNWANTEASKLQNVKGNIISVDESILDGFPKGRPSRCASLDSIRIMLDKDGYQTHDPEKNVLRTSDGNVTHDWEPQ